MTDFKTNPIGFLQEFCQKNRKPLPEYRDCGSSGAAHCRRFFYCCFFEGFEVKASSRQKHEAKSKVAFKMITLLIENNYFERYHVRLDCNRREKPAAAASDSFINAPFTNCEENHNTNIISRPHCNPIGFLLEFCQKYGLNFPQFTDCGSTGPDHCKIFYCSCSFYQFTVKASSRTKQQAKSKAARRMVEVLEENNYFEGYPIPNEDGENIPDNDPSGEDLVPVLYEYCHWNKLALPIFVVEFKEGKLFCTCTVGDRKTYGNGNCERSAKINTSYKMCSVLDIDSDILTNDNNEYTIKNLTDWRKNPKSFLKIFCAQDDLLPDPVYEIKGKDPLLGNVFLVTCVVGDISCEGRGSTLKKAKISAAKNVVVRLKNKGYNIASPISVGQEQKLSLQGNLRRPAIVSEFHQNQELREEEGSVYNYHPEDPGEVIFNNCKLKFDQETTDKIIVKVTVEIHDKDQRKPVKQHKYNDQISISSPTVKGVASNPRTDAGRNSGKPTTPSLVVTTFVYDD